MARYLKTMAVLTALFGIAIGFGFASLVRGDQEYALRRGARERNPGNILFETEFRVAEARHVFLVYSATAGFLVAMVGGSLLWGVGALHARLDRRP